MSKNAYISRTAKNHTEADKLKIISDYHYIIRYQRGGEAANNVTNLEDTLTKGISSARNGITMIKGVMQKGQDIAHKIDNDPGFSQLKKTALKHPEIKKAHDTAKEIARSIDRGVGQVDKLLGYESESVQVMK